MKKVVIFGVLLSGMSVLLAASGSDMKILVGEHRLCVPSMNFRREAGLFDWIYRIPGLDKETDGFLFNFSAEEVSAAITNYKIRDGLGVKHDLLGVMQYLSDDDRVRNRKKTGLAEMWLKQGAYRGRYIEKDEEMGLYKVFATSESASMKVWNLFSQYPDETHAVPDLFSFSVASCQVGMNIAGQQGPDLCDLDFIGLSHVEVKASVSGDNLHLYRPIQEFIRGKLREWEAACN